MMRYELNSCDRRQNQQYKNMELCLHKEAFIIYYLIRLY